MKFFWLVLGAISVSACLNPGGRETSADKGANRNDLILVQRLLSHGNVHARLLEICKSRAMHDELKQDCAKSLDYTLERNNRLRNWQTQWSASSGTIAPMIHDKDTVLFSQLSDIQGEVFDQAVLHALVLHAHEGLTEADACNKQAKHSDLKLFCAQLHPNFHRALDAVAKWRCSWFGSCSSAE
jgi:hypothetical protein